MHLLNMRRNKLVAVQWCRPLALRRLAWATLITLLILMPDVARGSELLTNGNFSSGLSGWSTSNSGTGSWSVYTGSPVAGLPAPTANGVVTDLDSAASGTHILLQSFVIPAGATSVTLSFDMFVWNLGPIAYQDYHNYDYTTSYHNEAWAEIVLPGSDPFALAAPLVYALYQTPNGQTTPAPSGFTTQTYDLSSLAAGTYALRFVEVNNDKSPSGPFYMGLDNASVMYSTGSSGGGGDTPPPTEGGEAPEPATFLLFGAGFVAFGLWRRKAKTAAAAA